MRIFQAGLLLSRQTLTYLSLCSFSFSSSRREKISKASMKTTISVPAKSSLRTHVVYAQFPPLPSQPKELKIHHKAAMDALRAKLKSRLFNAVKGDNNQTLVGSFVQVLNVSPWISGLERGTWASATFLPTWRSGFPLRST